MRNNVGVDEERASEDGGLVSAEDGEHVVIRDGDGLAVIGEPSAVEQYLRRAGLWEDSARLDLSWLRPLLVFGADAADAVAVLVTSPASASPCVIVYADGALHVTEPPGSRVVAHTNPGAAARRGSLIVTSVTVVDPVLVTVKV